MSMGSSVLSHDSNTPWRGTLPPDRGGTWGFVGGRAVSLISILLIGLWIVFSWGPSESVRVTSWHTGNSGVAGTFQNGALGCSHLQILLQAVDHHDFVVQEATIELGQVPAGRGRAWSSNFTGLVGNDIIIEQRVVTIRAALHCNDS